jgi:hypothetical protein
MMRERNEKVAFAKLLVHACTVGRLVSDDIVTDIIEEYREEVTQERYNLGYETAQHRRTIRRSRETVELTRRLAKVSDMTVSDEEFEEALDARSK